VSDELPAAAMAGEARARPGGAWGSALSAQEFAAIRGAGFEPAGQVFGAAVYAAGDARGYDCPGVRGSSGATTPAPPVAQVSGRGDLGSFGLLVQAMYQARQAAIGRMAAECAGLGGHGVVGVRLRRGPFRLGGLEFTAIGTAVRAPGVAPGRGSPFTSGLSGQDFAKLVMTGWVPAGLVLGISIGSRHDDRATARQTRRWSGNAEVAGWTELVNRSRHDARRALEDDVRQLGAEGVVIAGMQMRVRQRDCPAAAGRRDHIVEATITGTAIARFAHAGQHRASPALTVMPLGPQNGQTAKISI
jgi:uncharacterized protein YbjQ (UPF0145 family)